MLFYRHFIIRNKAKIDVAFSPGIEACVKLSQFEEAIVLCDRGLAVSFENILDPALIKTFCPASRVVLLKQLDTIRHLSDFV